jgi:hypothetical protein
MGIGAGIFLMAVGAILKYAINADLEGVSIDTIGTILIVAGAAVSIISLLLYAMNRDGVRRGRVVEERYDVVEDRTIDTRI